MDIVEPMHASARRWQKLVFVVVSVLVLVLVSVLVLVLVVVVVVASGEWWVMVVVAEQW